MQLLVCNSMVCCGSYLGLIGASVSEPMVWPKSMVTTNSVSICNSMVCCGSYLGLIGANVSEPHTCRNLSLAARDRNKTISEL